MERDEDVIELGAASVETQGGPAGVPEPIQFELGAGISEDF